MLQCYMHSSTCWWFRDYGVQGCSDLGFRVSERWFEVGFVPILAPRVRDILCGEAEFQFGDKGLGPWGPEP